MVRSSQIEPKLSTGRIKIRVFTSCEDDGHDTQEYDYLDNLPVGVVTYITLIKTKN